MSYILDALRKAEAERRTGGAPDVLATPVFGAAQLERRHRWHGSRWLWLLPAAAAGALATAMWLTWQAPVPVQPRPVPTPSISAPTPQPIAPPAPAAPPVTLHEPPAPVIEAARPAAPAEVPKHASGRNASPSAAQHPQADIASLRELPAEIQRQIPPLSISGYIYAANPADRSVLINRKLLREGDEIMPGLVLEKLLPNGLVLNYKGYRYRTGY